MALLPQGLEAVGMPSLELSASMSLHLGASGEGVQARKLFLSPEKDWRAVGMHSMELSASMSLHLGTSGEGVHVHMHAHKQAVSVTEGGLQGGRGDALELIQRLHVAAPKDIREVGRARRRRGPCCAVVIGEGPF